MQEFLLLFRRDFTTQPSELHIKHWQDWFRSLAADDKLARPVQRFEPAGKLLKKEKTEEGPYTAMNESVGGLLMIKANSYEEAMEIAQGCPVLDLGGNVEIRRVV
jgi:hypothetical protein